MKNKFSNFKIKLLNYDKVMWKSLFYCSSICAKIHWRYPKFINCKVYHTYSKDRKSRITHCEQIKK